MLGKSGLCSATALVLAWLTAACADRGETGEPTAPRKNVPPATLPLLASGEVDLSSVMDRARLAFYPRRDDASFETGTHRWYARADEASFTVVPAGWTAMVSDSGGIEVRTASLRRGKWRWSTEVGFRPDGKGGLARTSGLITEWLRGTDGGIEQGWTIAEAPPGPGTLEVALDVAGIGSADSVAEGIRLDTPSGAVVYGHATWIEADGDRIPVKARWQSEQILLSVPGSIVATAAYPVVLDPLVGPEEQTDPYAWLPQIPFGGQAICTSTGCISSFTDSGYTNAVRFTLDGELLDPQPVPMPTFSSVVDMAAMGNNIALVGAGPNNTGVEFRLVDSNGALVAPALTLDPTGIPGYSAVGCSSTQCLAIWRTSANDVFGIRIAMDATPLDAAPFYIATPTTSNVAVGWNGTNYLVATGGSGMRVAPDGTLLDPVINLYIGPTEIASNGDGWMAFTSSSHQAVYSDGTTGPVLLHNEGTDVAWTGSAYIMGENHIYKLRDESGTQIGGTFFVGSINGYAFNLASIASVPGGGAFLVAYSPNGGGLAKIDSSGTITYGPVTLGHRANAQRSPFLVAGDGQYLLVWWDERVGASGAILGLRLTPDGEPLDQVPIFVTSAAHAVDRLAATFNGSIYAVAVSDFQTTRAVRIAPDGSVLDSTPIPLGGSSERVAMTSDGNNFLIVTQNGSYLHGRLLYADGTVSGGQIGSMMSARPSAAFSGTHYLMIGYEGGNMSYREITPGGIAGQITTATVAGGPHPISAACVGPTCLLATYAEFLTLPVAPVQLNGPVNLGRPAVAGAGDEFVVVAPDSAPIDDIVAARFSASSPPAQIGGWFPVTQTPNLEESEPTVATLGDNGALVAYVREDEGVDRQRVFIRSLILATPLGTTCSFDTDCQSSFCVDGFCCDQACGDGQPGDCQACAAALGASADGTCSVLAAGAVCRDSVGDCDVAETCDGNFSVCPADAVVEAGQLCRLSGGECDLVEECDGSSPLCPTDLKNVGQLCRPAAGPCDQEETCASSSNSCPADLVRAAGVLCRSAAGSCDLEEACDGEGTDCPGDELAPIGTSCRPSIGECDAEEVCSGSDVECGEDAAAPEGSACGPAPSGACDAANACEGADGAAAVCVDRIAPDGTACEDGGVCQAGACASTPTGGSDGSGSSDGGDDTSGGDVQSAEGCSCQVPGSPTQTRAWALLWLALLARRRQEARPSRPS